MFQTNHFDVFKGYFSKGIIDEEIYWNVLIPRRRLTVGVIHKGRFDSIFYSSVCSKWYLKFHIILAAVFNHYYANEHF